MGEFATFGVYLLIGLLGALGHYMIKRHWNREIDCDLWHYITFNRPATTAAVGVIIAAEFTLAVSGAAFTLSNIAAAFLAGYTADNAMNKANK